jgi:two-component system LytT family response regulator
VLSVLIADSDPTTRQVLRNILVGIPGIEIVGETGNGIEAINMYEKLKPQSVVINPDIPGMTGLEVVKEIIDINPRTYIVFFTEKTELQIDYQEYAFDYVVKPFKSDKVKKVMWDLLLNALKKLPSVESEFIEVKLNDGLDLYLNDIIYITRKDRKTIICLKREKNLIVSDTLGSLEEKLKDHMFFRTHKSFIVNLRMVKELVVHGRGTHCVVMENTQDTPLLSSENKEILEKLLKW